MEYVKLSNGVEMPKITFGVLSLKTQEAMDSCISTAWQSGFTAFDNGYRYYNEREFGNALHNLNIPRKDVFITDKSRMLRHQFDDAIDTVYSQLKSIQTSYFDLYLIHWPQPAKPPLYLQAWSAYEKLYGDGVLRAIGISNFFVPQMEKLLEVAKIVPMVNQLQINPYYYNKEVIDFCQSHGIQVQAWWPLGGAENSCLKDEKLIPIAAKYGKSVAQVVLRWHIQHNIIPNPGSTNPDHVKELIDIFDFALTEEEMATIDGLNTGIGKMPRGRHYDPENFPMMW
ncbi:MAG: aldo/keto reductase [Lachnospiraceae bacterium]|jgi:diketogulonate reductase-like aldo/keto reductase|nr:aldo/keto reductase [Lachnospiraceae bacterium]